MAILKCAWCGFNREIENSGYFKAGLVYHPILTDIIRGYLECGNCKRRTIFTLEGRAFTYLPGRIFEEDVTGNVAPNAREMFEEALLCLYGGSGRGVVSFARSAVEEALSAKGVTGKDLFKKIADAKKHGILGEAEEAQANNARLVGKLTLHYMMEVTQAEAIGALVATVSLLNHIAKQKPAPASQSGTESNGE